MQGLRTVVRPVLVCILNVLLLFLYYTASYVSFIRDNMVISLITF